jgi:hypothetical protein
MASVELNTELMDKRVLRCNGKVPTSRDNYFLSFKDCLDDPFAQAI